jgi:hypothetical protein
MEKLEGVRDQKGGHQGYRIVRKTLWDAEAHGGTR